eukprot:Opistho-2@40046
MSSSYMCTICAQKVPTAEAIKHFTPCIQGWIEKALAGVTRDADLDDASSMDSASAGQLAAVKRTLSDTTKRLEAIAAQSDENGKRLDLITGGAARDSMTAKRVTDLSTKIEHALSGKVGFGDLEKELDRQKSTMMAELKDFILATQAESVKAIRKGLDQGTMRVPLGISVVQEPPVHRDGQSTAVFRLEAKFGSAENDKGDSTHQKADKAQAPAKPSPKKKAATTTA